jgi:hypothetical protein
MSKTMCSKLRSRFPFLAEYTVGNGVVDFWHVFETLFLSIQFAPEKAFFCRLRESARLKVPSTKRVLTFAMLFYENNRRRKFSSREKYQIHKILIFFGSSIICSVFLIQVLKLNFRCDFLENFTALLLKGEFVLGDPRNRT